MQVLCLVCVRFCVWRACRFLCLACVQIFVFGVRAGFCVWDVRAGFVLGVLGVHASFVLAVCVFCV